MLGRHICLPSCNQTGMQRCNGALTHHVTCNDWGDGQLRWKHIACSGAKDGRPTCVLLLLRCFHNNHGHQYSPRTRCDPTDGVGLLGNGTAWDSRCIPNSMAPCILNVKVNVGAKGCASSTLVPNVLRIQDGYRRPWHPGHSTGSSRLAHWVGERR